MKELRKKSVDRALRVMCFECVHRRNLAFGVLLSDGQCRKAMFSEACLFWTQERAGSTVLYRKMLSDNEIFLL